MEIRYLAHASFLLTTQAGTRIVTDPLDPAGYPDALKYRAFGEPADIVTISHEHADHGAAHLIKGTPIVIKGNGKFIASEVEFLGVETYHDASRGAERGKNTVFIMSVDGLRIAHMGDLGHVLTSDQAAEIGAVDIALIPVGGFFTIDAAGATKVAEQIEAKIVIPMHYRTDKCAFPIATVDDFVAGKTNVTRPGSSTLEITKETLPQQQQIIVLNYSL